jgi:hypothetical protein
VLPHGHGRGDAAAVRAGDRRFALMQKLHGRSPYGNRLCTDGQRRRTVIRTCPASGSYASPVIPDRGLTRCAAGVRPRATAALSMTNVARFVIGGIP